MNSEGTQNKDKNRKVREDWYNVGAQADWLCRVKVGMVGKDYIRS